MLKIYSLTLALTIEKLDDILILPMVCFGIHRNVQQSQSTSTANLVQTKSHGLTVILVPSILSDWLVHWILLSHLTYQIGGMYPLPAQNPWWKKQRGKGKSKRVPEYLHARLSESSSTSEVTLTESLSDLTTSPNSSNSASKSSSSSSSSWSTSKSCFQ